MKTLAVMANTGKEKAPAVLRRLEAKARALGIVLLADEATGRLLSSVRVLPCPALFDEADAVMALGGDGSMLRAVRELDGRDKPVIGVNLGSLGFLTSVAEEDLERAMDCLAAGTVTCTANAIIECHAARPGAAPIRYHGLNDVVVRSGSSPRVLTIDVSIDGQPVTSYMCDGIIVATPAGSTGHSLSAGGPILTPATSAFVVSLICPHTLSSRPLVVQDRSEIVVAIAGAAGEVLLSVDGQVGQPLLRGDVVRIRRSSANVRLIHLPGYSYFGVLRQKLHWSGRNV